MCDGVKFQIKCNRVTAATVNVRLKDMPTVKNLGAPNDRMFQYIRTSEGSQIASSILKKRFWVMWSCPENYLSVEMSKRNFGRLESFWLIFSSHPNL